MKQKRLTEEMPETLRDINCRGLVVNESGNIESQDNKQRYLTEDLPQEEEDENQ